MFVNKHVVNVTTAADGSAEVYTEKILNGPILKILYAEAASGGFVDGVDFSITTETTGQTVWSENDVNASKNICPREAVQDSAGADVTFDGTNEIYDYIYACNERLKIVIADGGDTKTGTFTILEG